MICCSSCVLYNLNSIWLHPMFYTGGRLGSISSVMSDGATPSVRHADREIGEMRDASSTTRLSAAPWLRGMRKGFRLCFLGHDVRGPATVVTPGGGRVQVNDYIKATTRFLPPLPPTMFLFQMINIGC